jgi:hypothetical protein
VVADVRWALVPARHAPGVSRARRTPADRPRNRPPFGPHRAGSLGRVAVLAGPAGWQVVRGRPQDRRHGDLWLAGVGSALAVIFGAVALSRIKGSSGRLIGSGLATAGIVVGSIGILLAAGLGLVIPEIVSLSGPKTLSFGQAAVPFPDIDGIDSVTVQRFSGSAVQRDDLFEHHPGRRARRAGLRQRSRSDAAKSFDDAQATIRWRWRH